MSAFQKTFKIGGDLEFNRLGYGAMRITGDGIWGEPKDPAECKRVLKRAVELRHPASSTPPTATAPTSASASSAKPSRHFPKARLVVATKAASCASAPNKWVEVEACRSIFSRKSR